MALKQKKSNNICFQKETFYYLSLFIFYLKTININNNNFNSKLLTVRSNTQKGKENGELESDVYNTVSFSAPSIIASSNNIAENEYFFCINI